MLNWLKKHFTSNDKKTLSGIALIPVTDQVSPHGNVIKDIDHQAQGDLHYQGGKLPDAIHSYQLALLNAPRDPLLLNKLGDVFYEQADYLKAEQQYRQALNIKPDFMEAKLNLGLCLNDMLRYAEALACYQHIIIVQPDNYLAHFNLAVTQTAIGNGHEALAAYSRVLELKPGFSHAHFNMGILFQRERNLDEAEKHYLAVISATPHYFSAYRNLGVLYQENEQFAKAQEQFMQALRINPQHAEASRNFSDLLFALNYDPDRSAEEIFAAYQKYEKLYADRYRREWPIFNNDETRQRRLKIGYVSPDFRHHAVQYFLEPLMAHHNKEMVEVYVYAENTLEDAVTERYKSYADHWIATAGLSDAALCERIRADGIDILLDLAGHTANNRLSVFARKAAPIQVSWLGYGYTTGLIAIDYLLTDEASAPVGSESLFAEQPWRLPSPMLAYRPAQGMGDVSTLPALKNGYVTIGTLTRSIRLNHKTIRVWAAILKRLETAKLVINSGNYQYDNFRQSLIEKFAAHGISEQRLDIGFHSPPWDTLRNLDIGLDCFPHNSGTTLFETLYMGVPFVTLAGRPSVGRLGKSILEGLGRPEWVADSEEDYIDRVVSLAADIEQLALLRRGLREEMQKSSLMDEPGFTRKVEDAFQSMWSKWTESVNISV